MIALTLAVALVTVTPQGQLSIVQDLTPTRCEDARSVALYGEDVEHHRLTELQQLADSIVAQGERETYYRALHVKQLAWEQANPKAAANCRQIELRMTMGGDCGPEHPVVGVIDAEGYYPQVSLYTGGWSSDRVLVARAECVK